MKVLIAAASVGMLFVAAVLLASFDIGRFFLSGIMPYLALLLFTIGMTARVLYWARSPVPFRITTSAGQQKSLSWIKHSPIENPSSKVGVVIRVALEMVSFRSLLRNTKVEPSSGPSKVVYASAVGLWFFSLIFHWSLAFILVRHLRFFTDPIPSAILLLQRADGFFDLTVPALYATGALFLACGLYLAGRRLLNDKVRYLSFISDYFFLFLLIGIGISGVLLRYIVKTDLVGIKEITMGIVTFSPASPQGISALFYGHLFLVMCLFALFPFSKLVHGIGLLFSPTRNMSADSRAKRHINPWNDPSIVPRSYEDYENEFRDKMKAANIPVDRE